MLVFSIIIWVVCMYVGYEIGESKGRHGFWWAFWLGPIGVMAVALLPPIVGYNESSNTTWVSTSRNQLEEGPCPRCKTVIGQGYTACPYCGYHVEKPSLKSVGVIHKDQGKNEQKLRCPHCGCGYNETFYNERLSTGKTMCPKCKKYTPENEIEFV